MENILRMCIDDEKKWLKRILIPDRRTIDDLRMLFSGLCIGNIETKKSKVLLHHA